MKRGSVTGVGPKIGVGKESDIYVLYLPDGSTAVGKFARLGRTSFKTVKNNRDYLRGKTCNNWLYLSRLSAIKEYAFMSALHERDFPVPTPIDQN
jgi:RIO kinase 2